MDEIIRVSDLMVPRDEYATVGDDATLYEAVIALEKAQEELQSDMVAIMRNAGDLQCQALAPQNVGDVSCNPVHVSGIGDSYQIIFLNAADGRVVMVQQPSVSPMTGAPVTMKVYINEYMETDGFTMPKKLRIDYDDEEFGVGTVETFQANPEVDMSIFTK